MRWSSFPPYISVAEREAKAEKEACKLAKKGQRLSPVKLAGRTITESFWGNAWCEHLESYHDYENRLPRGRSYVRNGSVIDLRIEKGNVAALVSGSSIYSVDIQIKPVVASRWKKIVTACAGKIESLIEILSGQLSHSVMKVVTDRNAGLFPAPKEITMQCSCPDWAVMCKHVAAVLYGIGSRFDHQPELLFQLRGVDHKDLLGALPSVNVAPTDHWIDDSALADIFGIELAENIETSGDKKALRHVQSKRKKTGKRQAGKTKLRKTPKLKNIRKRAVK